jgi:PPP family 3-phenylpropionic acid transporter
VLPAARLRSFYFLYYGAVGVYLPYFAAYLRGLGFTGEEIGRVQMVAPLVAAPVAIAWATASDRVGAPVRALGFATLWSAAAIAFLPLARAPWTIAAVLFAYSLADRAIVPLLDSVTLEWVRASAGASYARIRLFGSIGYVAAAQGVGLLLAARGDRAGDVLVPIAVAALVAGQALVARRLPPAPRPADDDAPAGSALGNLRALARDGRLRLLLAACAIHWTACAPFHVFFGVLVRDAGLPSTVTGLGMAVGVAAEMLALVLFPHLERRFGLRALFIASFAATAVRWWLTSRAEGAAALVLAQSLHALTFGVYWGASVNAMARLVPPRLRATGQALYTAIVFGAGNAVGYWLSGAGYDRFGGAAPLYAIAAVVELAPLLLAVFAFPRTPTSR